MIPSWQPSCSLELIHLRAKLLHEIRSFFYAQNVLEVETPILCQAVGTDPYLEFFSTSQLPDNQDSLYLQTSPEFALKRLLAANTGSIYQITKAFRKSESGRYHNPEFSMLEWYRLDFNLQQLMDDVELLFSHILPAKFFSEKAQRICYVDVFHQYTGLNALQFERRKYQTAAVRLGFPEAEEVCGDNHTTWLDFLFSHIVQQHLGIAGICMVYEYPACLPSLARLNLENPLVTERVEVFIQGIELGNGYYELTDMQQQKKRFDQEIKLRQKIGAEKVSADERFLAALHSGLPDCSGIAIGLDRILMIISETDKIDDVLAFPIKNA
ncbi:EF-P lysine aminoacylase GenX [Methylococcaceae bacterium HT4]|nr:EF-P lysine aminoacylase GenX [Methylococcaceae bacterium HT4]TXL21049.1 EF-P lysine aminoacylase GenX [Methylococcaceae bacterium HT5]